MQKTRFMYSDNTVDVFSFDEQRLTDKLNPAVYTLSYDQMKGYYLEFQRQTYEIPKLYGSVSRRTEKVIKTYNKREGSTAVLATGNRGSGKTLLLKNISNKMIEDGGIPVILVNEPFHGNDFNAFIDKIGECVLIFDEFGKVYKNSGDESDQEKLLTFLDGTVSKKRLVLLTENREAMINEFFMNRPSRIFYHWRYSRLEDSVVYQYCEEHGVSEKFASRIIEWSTKLEEFTFDILQAIVEEYKMYGGDIKEILEDINVVWVYSEKRKIKLNKLTNALTNEEMILKDKSITSIDEQFRIRYYRPDDKENVQTVTYDEDDLVEKSGSKAVYSFDEMILSVDIVSKNEIDYRQYI